jgi:hypothetical protein
MRERHVGFSWSCEPDFAGSTVRPIGVLTDRDIVVGVVARDSEPAQLARARCHDAQPVVLNAADQIFDRSSGNCAASASGACPVVG